MVDLQKVPWATEMWSGKSPQASWEASQPSQIHSLRAVVRATAGC